LDEDITLANSCSCATLLRRTANDNLRQISSDVYVGCILAATNMADLVDFDAVNRPENDDPSIGRADRTGYVAA
jgi:hypothetical protein